jgi:hypothetical protein
MPARLCLNAVTEGLLPNAGAFLRTGKTLCKEKPKIHGNSLKTKKPAEGYTLRDRDTGDTLKYGETTRGRKRYSEKYLESNNAEMVFEAQGTKSEMHQWQHDKILDYKADNAGNRPPLNRSDY